MYALLQEGAYQRRLMQLILFGMISLLHIAVVQFMIFGSSPLWIWHTTSFKYDYPFFAIPLALYVLYLDHLYKLPEVKLKHTLTEKRTKVRQAFEQKANRSANIILSSGLISIDGMPFDKKENVVAQGLEGGIEPYDMWDKHRAYWSTYASNCLR